MLNSCGFFLVKNSTFLPTFLIHKYVVHALFFPVTFSDKNHCDINGLVAAKVHDYSLYSTTNILKSTGQVKHAIQHVSTTITTSNSSSSNSNGRQMDGSAENGKIFQCLTKKKIASYRIASHRSMYTSSAEARKKCCEKKPSNFSFDLI